MKKIILIAVLSVLGLTAVHAETRKASAVTNLPDISVIGNFLATHSSLKKLFDVKEIEFSFQQYLYPSVRANIFAALHKDAEGKRSLELEEGYVEFSDFLGVLAPNSAVPSNVGAIVGKKLMGIGKLNPLHPEQWHFVDRPIAHQKFLGGEEGLSAEGVQASTVLPFPFFSQIELGYWTAGVDAHAEESEEEGHGVEYEGRLLNARLWNSFELAANQELELGASYLKGNASSSSSDASPELLGFDVTLSQELGSERFFQLQTEVFQAQYGEEGESRERQTGAVIAGVYRFSPQYQLGLRFGTLGKHGDEGNVQNQWAAMVTRQLTETSKFRLQYNTGENVEDTVLAQFIFGIGPHAHVLQ